MLYLQNSFHICKNKYTNISLCLKMTMKCSMRSYCTKPSKKLFCNHGQTPFRFFVSLSSDLMKQTLFSLILGFLFKVLPRNKVPGEYSLKYCFIYNFEECFHENCDDKDSPNRENNRKVYDV